MKICVLFLFIGNTFYVYWLPLLFWKNCFVTDKFGLSKKSVFCIEMKFNLPHMNREYQGCRHSIGKLSKMIIFSVFFWLFFEASSIFWGSDGSCLKSNHRIKLNLSKSLIEVAIFFDITYIFRLSTRICFGPAVLAWPAVWCKLLQPLDEGSSQQPPTGWIRSKALWGYRLAFR